MELNDGLKVRANYSVPDYDRHLIGGQRIPVNARYGLGTAEYGNVEWTDHPTMRGGQVPIPRSLVSDPRYPAEVADYLKSRQIKQGQGGDHIFYDRSLPPLLKQMGMEVEANPQAQKWISATEHKPMERGEYSTKLNQRTNPADYKTVIPGFENAVGRAQMMGEDIGQYFQPHFTREQFAQSLPQRSDLVSVDQTMADLDDLMDYGKRTPGVVAERYYRGDGGGVDDIREGIYRSQGFGASGDRVFQRGRSSSPQQWDGSYRAIGEYETLASQIPIANDTYRQEMGDYIPRDFYTDPGYAQHVAPQIKGYMGDAEALPFAPQHTTRERRNTVPLGDAYISSADEQARLRQALPAQPKPYGTMRMDTNSIQLGEMPDIREPIPNAYIQREGKLLPYTPSADLNERSNELADVVIEDGRGSRYPYVAGASVELSPGFEIPYDPQMSPDAVDAILSAQRRFNNLEAQGLVNKRSPSVPPSKTEEVFRKADAAIDRLDNLQGAYNSLARIDPAMNVASQGFDVEVELRPQAVRKDIPDLLHQYGLDPVVQGNTVRASGNLPVGNQVELAQSLRASLRPEESSYGDIPSDPEMVELRRQGKQWRRDYGQLSTPAARNLAGHLDAINQQLGREPQRLSPQAAGVMADQLKTIKEQVKPMRGRYDYLDSMDGPSMEQLDAIARGGRMNFNANELVPTAGAFEMVGQPVTNYQASRPADWNYTPRPQPAMQMRPIIERGGYRAVPMERGLVVNSSPTRMIHSPAAVAPTPNPRAGLLRKAGIGGAILGGVTLGGMTINNLMRQQQEADEQEMLMRGY